MPTLSGSTERTTTQPAPLPVNLDQRLDISRALLSIGGLLLGAILFAIGSGLWGYGSGDAMEYRTSGQWTSSIVGLAFMLAGAGVFLLSFVYLASIVRYEMQARWLWTHQSLAERQEQGGIIIEEERTDWALRVDDPRDMLLIAIYVYMQVRAGKRTPWSNDSLAGELYIGSQNRARLIGKLSEHQSREVGRELARMGLVRGRTDKVAGQWVIQDADELLERFVGHMR